MSLPDAEKKVALDAKEDCCNLQRFYFVHASIALGGNVGVGKQDWSLIPCTLSSLRRCLIDCLAALPSFTCE